MSYARSELIPVVNNTKTSHSANLIFVHGINGDPRTTWMTNNKREGFPEESWLYWLGKDIPDVAVWTLGYPASASGWKGFTMELKDRADNIINLLLNHPNLDKNHSVIFVAHSMGGLLVKYILRRALSGDYPNARSLAEQTKGIVFLSTPHRGSNLANFIERLAFLLPSVNVSELKKEEPTLIDLNSWFCTNFNQLDLQVKVFSESRPTPVKKSFWGNLIRKIVVDKYSATLALPDVTLTSLDVDHSSICWVESHQFRNIDQLYGNICQFIKECLSNYLDNDHSLVNNNTRTQVLHWKLLHKKYQDLCLKLIIVRGLISSDDYEIMLHDLEHHWRNECINLICQCTELSRIISIGTVKAEFENEDRRNNLTKQIKILAKNINSLVDECVEPKDLAPKMKAIRSYFSSLENINSYILTFIDDKLKIKIGELKPDFENSDRA